MEILANLHFITSRFGIDGFRVWRDIMSLGVDLMSTIRKEDRVSILKGIRLLFGIKPTLCGM